MGQQPIRRERDAPAWQTGSCDLDGRDVRRGAARLAAERGARVLIYSHDTFGLGHLRRSRAIANALVAERPGASVVIISGSPVIGNFEFGSGVDYVRIPGVTKLPDGDYRSLNLNVSLDEAVGLREAIILQTAETLPARRVHRRQGADRASAARSLPALERLQQPRLPPRARHPRRHGRAGAARARMGAQGRHRRARPLLRRDLGLRPARTSTSRSPALDLPREVERRITYTGYLRREMPQEPGLTRYPKITQAALHPRHDRRRRRRRRPHRLGDLGLRGRPDHRAAGARSSSARSSTATGGAASWSASPATRSSTPSPSTPRSSC